VKRAQINIFMILCVIFGVWPKFCTPQVKNGHYLINGSMKLTQKNSRTCSYCFLSIPMGIGCHIDGQSNLLTLIVRHCT
ncbi:hypothetical protein B0H14DRAFT_3041401, partial [Mycena olivaceomarginata]